MSRPMPDQVWVVRDCGGLVTFPTEASAKSAAHWQDEVLGSGHYLRNDGDLVVVDRQTVEGAAELLERTGWPQTAALLRCALTDRHSTAAPPSTLEAGDDGPSTAPPAVGVAVGQGGAS